MDIDHTFVTSDYHFRDWKVGLLSESTEEDPPTEAID